jgi:uncharacterized delta-60 repeat protein
MSGSSPDRDAGTAVRPLNLEATGCKHPRMRRLAVPTATILLAALLMSPAARADLSAGSLDPTFADGGTTTLVQGTFSTIHALAIQPDGQVVVVGGAGDSRRSTFAVARYDRHGVLDPTFSGDGRIRTRIGDSPSADAVVVQTDGRIVVAGQASSPTYRDEIAMVRYLPDGSLDRSFGDNGRVTATKIGGVSVSGITSLALDANGRIVAAAYADDGSKYDFGVIRFTSDGSLDPTFSGDGVAIAQFRHDALVGSIAIQSDGKIVLAGGARFHGSRFALARLRPDGALDGTFSDDGKRTIGFGGRGSYGGDVALQGDGKIVVAGSVRHGPRSAYGQLSIALARLDADGTLDPSFAGDGRRTTTGDGNLRAAAVTIQTDGKIVVGGQSTPTIDEYPDDFAVARYLTDGSLDPSFGRGGVTVTSILVDDWVEGIGSQPNGKIVVAGPTAGPSKGGGAIARYLP